MPNLSVLLSISESRPHDILPKGQEYASVPSGPEVHLPGFLTLMNAWPLELLPERGVAGEILASGSVWLFRGDFVMGSPHGPIHAQHGVHWGHQLCQQETVISGVLLLF